MDAPTLSALRQLARCLRDASACIGEIPHTRELDNIHAQLQSLKLILDTNREALQSRIADLEETVIRSGKRRAARGSDAR